MKDHYCDENLKFWKAVEEFRTTLTTFRRRNFSKEIYFNFIRKGAELEVLIFVKGINITWSIFTIKARGRS